MKRIVLTLTVFIAFSMMAFAQGANNIKINEVMTLNTQSIEDEYGNRGPWIEIVNTSYSTYNIRGMYITTDPSVLDKNMSVAERMKRMSIVPNGDTRTQLSAKQHIVFFLNSNPAKGALHLTANVDAAKSIWIGLYDGNAVDLIDSVTVPVLAYNTSCARQSDGSAKWVIKSEDAVTPGIDNFIQVSMTKVEKLKHDDPKGYGMTILCMGIVFASLALLYAFFTVFGYVADRRNKLQRVASMQPVKPIVKTGVILNEVRHKTTNILKDGIDTKGRDKEIYIAVIAMALRQYTEDVHDVESGVLTIKPHHSSWNDHGFLYNQNSSLM
ncbi:MAG: OadG family transporter subunit [Prevotellaceae bacterium]|nr:OadG family transporter subunit [Prevotellaceae bacterium]